MPTDMALKLKGIDGEATLAGHENEIEVSSFSLGATQSGTGGKAGGLSSGKASVHDLTIHKWVDKSTPLLFKYCATGEHIDDALLTVRKAGGGKVLDYFKINLKEVMITSVHTGKVQEDDRVEETITLNFVEIKQEYTPQTGKGAGGGAIVAGYNVGKGTGS
jgi:type VI secretion system secreted protein Hcp